VRPGKATLLVFQGIAILVLIEAVCQWCVANDVVITMIAMAAVWRLRAKLVPYTL
jgi:hypothetical protein